MCCSVGRSVDGKEGRQVSRKVGMPCPLFAGQYPVPSFKIFLDDQAKKKKIPHMLEREIGPGSRVRLCNARSKYGVVESSFLIHELV